MRHAQIHGGKSVKFLSVAVLTVLVSGCFSTEVQYKQGVSSVQRSKDEAACLRNSTASYPVRTVKQRTPKIYVPGNRVCNAGRCYGRPAYWTGGDVYTVDANKNARAQAYRQCLGAQGYQSVALPNCTGETREAVAKSTQSRYPGLSKESCVVQMKDGSVKIYTP